MKLKTYLEPTGKIYKHTNTVPVTPKNPTIPPATSHCKEGSLGKAEGNHAAAFLAVDYTGLYAKNNKGNNDSNNNKNTQANKQQAQKSE